MTDTILRLTNILKSPDSLQADVDPNLNTPISVGLKEALKEIEDAGIKLKRVTNLIVKTAQFNQLQVRLLQFLGHLAEELSRNEGGGTRISPEQHLFLKQVITTCIYHQTYLQLLTRNDIINQTYTRISNIQLITSAQIQDIETLLENSNETDAQDFITQITSTSSTTFENIKNLDTIVDAIRKAILIRPLTHNSSYTFIMLTGPPGTGKTSIARAVANFHSNSVFLNLDISALLGQYVGQTEKRISQLFKYVSENRNKKFTIILDELDIVLGSDTQNSPYLTTLRNSLQIALDPEYLGSNVVICGITNYFNKLNDVIRRRATNTFYIPIPSLAESLEFLFQEIERTYYLFSFEANQVLNSPLTDAYKNDIATRFSSINNARFTNANMKNIAATAIASAMTNPNNIFLNLQYNNLVLKICAPSRDVMVNSLNVQASDSSDFTAVSQEIQTNNNFFRYVFVIPDVESLRVGIEQTPVLTSATEEEYRQNNIVNN